MFVLTPKLPESCIVHLYYDPNTHAVPQVDTSLKSVMQARAKKNSHCAIKFSLLAYCRNYYNLLIRHSKQTTQNNLPKWQKHHRTAPSPMTDFGHYFAKNHATKKTDRTKMGARTPHPIWMNAVGQRNGLIVCGCPFRT